MTDIAFKLNKAKEGIQIKEKSSYLPSHPIYLAKSLLSSARSLPAMESGLYLLTQQVSSTLPTLQNL